MVTTNAPPRPKGLPKTISSDQEFALAVYRKDVRQEHHLITDKVYEMMNELQFCEFAAKPGTLNRIYEATQGRLVPPARGPGG